MEDSAFLKGIVERKNGLVNMKVVFIDIIRFSKRKTKTQNAIINKFTELTREAIRTISQKYIEYAQKNNLNFSTDLITVPTGDGVLLAYLFEGLERIHLDFSVEILKVISKYNNSCPCERFDEKRWCNCHPKFNIRIGIDEGPGIVFRDLNGNYNITGNVINMASRIMDLGDENTILMGDIAYKNLIDMTSEVTIEDDFKHYNEIRVKHGVFLDVHQYCPEELEFVNCETPADIQEFEQMIEMNKLLMRFMSNVGKPTEKENMENQLSSMAKIMSSMAQLSNTQNRGLITIDVQQEEE